MDTITISIYILCRSIYAIEYRYIRCPITTAGRIFTNPIGVRKTGTYSRNPANSEISDVTSTYY
jgi:hypothetical protein